MIFHNLIVIPVWSSEEVSAASIYFAAILDFQSPPHTTKWIKIIFLLRKEEDRRYSENAVVGLVHVTSISSESIFILSYPNN